ncbi:hypothetical protein F5148DRAFT_728986 [Russula earlei]|uniref:Uncharacterized protein n=1 Tax=Russula earlei TaxID=71964 RepID=A0ACC0UMF9_9AGAM|nr:hypothetical protein F5148DRAFT_728986 [Russula earlei]
MVSVIRVTSSLLSAKYIHITPFVCCTVLYIVNHCFEIYNHRTTFLQSLTIGFCYSFLNLLSLQNHRRDLGEMTISVCLYFWLETFCLLYVVIACQRFWTTFSNSWQCSEPCRSTWDRTK